MIRFEFLTGFVSIVIRRFLSRTMFNPLIVMIPFTISIVFNVTQLIYFRHLGRAIWHKTNAKVTILSSFLQLICLYCDNLIQLVNL